MWSEHFGSYLEDLGSLDEGDRDTLFTEQTPNGSTAILCFGEISIDVGVWPWKNDAKLGGRYPEPNELHVQGQP